MRRPATPLTFAVIAVITMVAFGCSSDSNSPTTPGNSVLALTNADVLVEGQSVSGQSVQRGHGEGSSTRFEARLMQDGMPATGHEAWIEFDRPPNMSMQMMGRHTGRLELHDDGTNGDMTAGDGVYSYEDMVGEYGCHANDAGSGEYHYEFYGVHQDGHESNHMTVEVTVTD